MSYARASQLKIDATAWDIFARHQPYYHILSDPKMLDPSPEAEGHFWLMGEEHIRMLTEYGGLRPVSGTGVDFGCGIGRLTRALRSLTTRQIGLDISSEMVDRAQMANAEYPSLEFRQIADGRFPLEAGSAELVISLFVFQHMSSQELMETTIGEIGRILAPGGRTVFQIPTITAFGSLAGALDTIPAALRRTLKHGGHDELSEMRERLRRIADGDDLELSNDDIMNKMMRLESRRMKSLPVWRLRRALQHAGLRVYRLERQQRGLWTLVAAERVN